MQRQQQQQQQLYSKNYNINLRKTIIENLCSLVIQHGSDMQLSEFKRCVGQVWDSNAGQAERYPLSSQGSTSDGLPIPRPLFVAILELKGKAKTRLTTNQVVVACDRLYRVFKKLREIKVLLSDITLMKSTKPLSVWEEKALIGSMYQSADSFFHHQEIDFFVDAPHPVDRPRPQAPEQERIGGEALGGSQQQGSSSSSRGYVGSSPLLVNSPFHGVQSTEATRDLPSSSQRPGFSSPLVGPFGPSSPLNNEGDNSPNIDQ